MYSSSPYQQFANSIQGSSPMKNSKSIEQRLTFQLKTLQLNKSEFYSANQSQNDPFIWNGKLRGPQNSPYEGGFFEVVIRLSSQYPFKPPKVKFKTKIYHPNVSKSTGLIACKLLQSDWSPTYSIHKLLQLIRKLLEHPKPQQSYQPQICYSYNKDSTQFSKIAKEWTQNYAKQPILRKSSTNY